MSPVGEFFPEISLGLLSTTVDEGGEGIEKNGYGRVNRDWSSPVQSQGRRNQIETDTLAITPLPQNWTRSIKSENI